MFLDSWDKIKVASPVWDIFKLLNESKLFYADAIISDLKGDTLNTLYYFDNLFKVSSKIVLLR